MRPLGPAAAVCLAVLLFPSAATSANVAPNPGFEANCGGVPCQWTASGFQGSPTTAVYDTQNPYSTPASVRITVSGRFGSIASDCVPIGPGQVSFSFWYRTGDSDVTNLQYIPNYFSTANCSPGGTAADAIHTVPTRDGQWHFSGIRTMNVPEGSRAVVLVLTVSCDPCIQGPATAVTNLDNVVFDAAAPTAVFLSRLSATATAGVVVIRWSAAVDPRILGFDVYRDGVRANRILIPARVHGGMHRFVDRRHGKQYSVRVVMPDGAVRWYGPVRVRAR